MNTHYDTIVIGGGPTGLTAGIYLSRAKVRALIIDAGTPGGQMLMTYDVANYPGIDHASGREIVATMLRQAKGFGAEVMSHADILAMDFAADPKWIEVEDEGRYTADTIIIATGGVPRTLGMASEQQFAGRGISYCATCDGDFFTGKKIAVIGGGNSALEEAVALTRYAQEVTVIHEFDHFQAQPWIVEEARRNPKIQFLMNQRVLGFERDESLQQVVAESKQTGHRTIVPAEGCFVFIGYAPHTEQFAGLVERTDRGEIITDEDLATSEPGVFAAGDCRVKRYRQITTAVGDGTTAALAAIDYLRNKAQNLEMEDVAVAATG